MKKTLLFLQLIITLLVLAFVPNNIFKVVLLLPVWWMAFGGLSRREWIVFFVINILFVLNDIGAIQNHFFQFTHPDLFGLPYWEFFMWGFYLLHLHRMFPPKVPKSLDLKLVLLALIFAQVFAIIPDRNMLLIVTTSVLLITFYFYHEAEDFLYCFYLMAMGVAVETVGLSYDLWSYPETDYNAALVQFVIMWGAIGLYFRHIMGGWLLEKTPNISIYRTQQPQLPLAFQKSIEIAEKLFRERKISESTNLFLEIEKSARQQGITLNYSFYCAYSQACLIQGNVRAAIELLREGLKYAASPFEKCFIYLQLCRIYRTMILMKNARMELGRAFAEMDLELPINSFFRSLQSVLEFLFYSFRTESLVTDENMRRILQIKVALYEEAGLSAYYFREDRMLMQCTLKSKRLAEQLGDSIQKVNWLGGSGCVWVILGWHSKARQLIDRAIGVARSIGEPYAMAKALLWKALYLDYRGLPSESAREFEQVLASSAANLFPSDLRLAATTLSCNYLIRGQMRASEAVIRNLTDMENPTCRYFSSGKAYVDWYRLPAISFLHESTEAKEILRANSQIAFFRVDEEKWQITQYLGGLLMYHYSLLEKNMPDILACLKRFELLRLPPQKTYLEASHFWVAKAHLMIDLAFEGKVSVNDAEKAVRELFRTVNHPNLRAHGLVAKAKCQLLKPNPNMSKLQDYLRKAMVLAEMHENIWVMYEILRFDFLKYQCLKDSASALKAEQKIREFCVAQEWKGMLR
ncbi:MAG: hypothetical protein ACXWC9_00215 [Pseudobdellovibrionaceae bacterium]